MSPTPAEGRILPFVRRLNGANAVERDIFPDAGGRALIRPGGGVRFNGDEDLTIA